MKINNVDIEFKDDYAIKQDVDLVFNSASGLLLMRTGTAKVIREYSEKLNPIETQEYQDLLKNFDNPIIKQYLQTFDVVNWEPRQAQLSSFQRVTENNSPFKTGDVILDKDWSKKHPKDIIHVIGMTYHLDNGKLDVNKVTPQSLTDVLTKALNKAINKKYTSIAIPVLCTRGDYGLSPRVSLESILDAINQVEINHIIKIIICFESEGPRNFLETINEEKYLGNKFAI